MSPRPPSAEEAERKRRAGQQMRADRQALLVSAPFLGVLAMRLDLVPVVDSRVPTAVTDGRALFADADFWLGLGEAGRLFVIGHEIWHCALQHLARRMGREPRRWNLAVDHEVNELLRSEGFEPLAGAVDFRELRGASAEQVYEALLKRPQVPERDPASADLHEPPGPDPAAAVQDPDYAPQADAALWRRWEAWTRAAAQQCRAAGTLPGWLEARIAAAGPPSVPWPRYLQRFIQQVRGGGPQWLPPSRRHWGRGLYLPSRRTQRLDLAIAVDTSGSTVDDWPQFRAELGGILRACDDYRLRLLQHDTRVVADVVYTPYQPLPAELPVYGGGGTDLQAPFERLEANPPTALVVLTDGLGPYPTQPPKYPVLWALTAGRSQAPAWGQVVRMS